MFDYHVSIEDLANSGQSCFGQAPPLPFLVLTLFLLRSGMTLPAEGSFGYEQGFPKLLEQYFVSKT